MRVLDQLKAHRTQAALITEFLESRPAKEREEWLEAFRRSDIYPTPAVLKLLEKNGLKGVNENGLIRFRRTVEGYVSGR